MTQDTDLLQTLLQQNELLKQLIAKVDKPKLGLHNDAGICKIYCNRQHGCLWYTVTNGQPQPLSYTAITGYIKDLKFEKTERRGKPCHKLQVTLVADRIYILETGHDTHFSKGLLSAFAILNPTQLLQPITISPQPGDDDSVLFCRVWVGSEYIKVSYSEDTDFKPIARQARTIVKAANELPF